jgi:CIC family chloride channel protein
VRTWRQESLAVRADELRQLARRSREVVLLAVVTGVVVGLAVRGFEYLIDESLHELEQAPLWLAAVAPGIGLVVTALILRFVGGGASPATADEYLRAFHDPAYRLRPRALVARLIASVATIGSGGAMGAEGPWVYGGSAIGSLIQRRLPRPFRGSDHRTLLVAGAAAGVAAVFKTPATGAIFALEVPYQGDMARRMLLPALVASASGYLTFVSLDDTVPLLNVGVFGANRFELIDLLGAVLVGVTCAVAARAFAKLLRYAKTFAHRSEVVRVGVASAVLVGVFAATYALTDERLSLGPGFTVFRDWLFVELDLAVWVLAAVFVLRCVATAAATAGGGVGGLFIPLVVGGGLIGRGIADVIHPERFQLYTLLGIAAFLGAGYRVPLAAVMFVAESTGRPNFIVPALFAAVAAELVMGGQSFSSYQRLPGTE